MTRSRWRVETNHDKLVQAARDRVFADYRMQSGELVVDTRACGASTHGDINSVPVEVFVMIESSDFRITKMPLNHGAGHMPVPEFGTVATMQPRR